jgi:hypothetical protein
MLKKTILGAAAAAAFGATALLPTSASAHWHRHHHPFFGFYAAPIYPAYSPAYYGYGPACFVRKRWVWMPGGWALIRRPVCY